jgi:Lon protease-like protein
MQSLNLFPLNMILFPGISIPLQIFEPRYLSLISDSLKTGSRFGVVGICDGSEVDIVPKIYSVGVLVSITDWYQQESSLLGVRIVAERKFRVLTSSVDRNDILNANVEYLPDEPSTPLDSFGSELTGLVKDLKKHPNFSQYMMPTIRDVKMLGWQLAQLLPIDDAEKAELLGLDDPSQRVLEIARWLESSSLGTS